MSPWRSLRYIHTGTLLKHEYHDLAGVVASKFPGNASQLTIEWGKGWVVVVVEVMATNRNNDFPEVVEGFVQIFYPPSSHYTYSRDLLYTFLVDIYPSLLKMPTTLKEFESVWPRLVEDLADHCTQYKMPQQPLDWFVEVSGVETVI